VGYASPGSLTSAAVWVICKYAVAGTVTTKTWATGVPSYSSVWNDRATLTYS
jgi:hypothetical protein